MQNILRAAPMRPHPIYLSVFAGVLRLHLSWGGRHSGGWHQAFGRSRQMETAEVAGGKRELVGVVCCGWWEMLLFVTWQWQKMLYSAVFLLERAYDYSCRV
jgi:hypothetical protein